MIDSTLQSVKALSEQIRIRLILLLLGREACVCELLEVFNMAQSKLSHHLIILRDAGLVETERRGKWNYYRAHPALLKGINKDLIGALSRQLAQDEIVDRDRAKLESVQKCDVVCR